MHPGRLMDGIRRTGRFALSGIRWMRDEAKGSGLGLSFLGVGAGLLLTGSTLAGGPLSLAHICLAIGIALVGTGAAFAVARRLDARPPAADTEELTRVKTLSERLERGIERLQDLQWELRDNETRYRDLLDNQNDIITRTDPQGRLSFVNRAFCRVFGVEAGAVLGTELKFDVLQGQKPDQPASDPARRIRYEQLLMTAIGPRWFAFEQHGILGEDGIVVEQQSIGRDITEQRRVQAELAETRDQALAANNAKSRFLAAMSHEIRTPMNGILGMTDLLMDTGLSAEQRSYAQAIDRSARTLLTIIDEILDLSKIEAGKLEMHPVQFPIDDCVQSVVELLAPKAVEKHIELVWRIDPETPNRLIGDETRVRQILLNLVGNAIKFTDKGGIVVHVNAERPRFVSETGQRETTVTIEVRDTGIGIAPGLMRSLFAEFEQPDDAARRKRGGTGLGLAISRRLARAMGGDIVVTSEPGRGTTFAATVRLIVADGALPIMHRDTNQFGRKVLLALDGPIERRELSDSLQQLDILAESASTKDAIAVLSEAGTTSPDAVLVDAAAGAVAAGRLLELARKGASRPARGVVLIDQFGRDSLASFRAAGFDAYLIRPVRPLSLVSQLGLNGTADWAQQTSKDISRPLPKLPNPLLRSRNILLVEDNEINALLARRVSERAGCHVIHAKSGAEALHHCESKLADLAAPLDLVLMDIHMPEMDGFETTARLKRLFATAGRRTPPIVALTANAFAEDRKRCLEAGLDDFLAKPFDRTELEAMLEKWCGAVAISRDGALDEFAA